MSSVYKAMAAVMSDISKTGIGKDQTNQAQRFKYRGVDDVMNSLAPLLAKHGLLVVPRVKERTVTERESRNGGVLFHTVLTVEYDFIAAEDGSMHTAIVVGEAMDSGDKASNKAMSIAYKYACFQAFSIPTEGEDKDPDSQTHDVKARPTRPRSAGRTPADDDLIPEGRQKGKRWADATIAYLEAVLDSDDAPAQMKERAQKEIDRRDAMRGAA